MYNNWQKYGIEVPYGRSSGNYKTTCPNCRDARGNPKDKSLSCNLATGQFYCHHCGWKGSVAEMEEWEKQERRRSYVGTHSTKRQKRDYKRPTPKQTTTTFSDRLLSYMSGRGISQQTLKAMKVTEGEEWMPEKGERKAGKINTVQFNYFLNGELVNTKYRSGDKAFKLVADAEKTFYNIDAIKGESTCIITEGEMDALSFYEACIHNVVSVPNGASDRLEWLEDYWEEFFGDKETIYIAGDNDTAGEKLKQELLRRFGAERCKVVEYGDGCKDANDHLQKYGAESLRKCISEAKDVPIAGAFTLANFEDRLEMMYYSGGLKQGATIGHPNFDALCSFETGSLGIVTGIPNHGKSEWLDEMVYRLNLRYGWKFAYFSPENEPLELHFSKLIEKYVGKKMGKETMSVAEYDYAKRHLNENYFFIKPDEGFSPIAILNISRSLVRRNGIKGLIIDPYNYLETETEHGQSETQYISALLSTLKNFAKINGIVVFLVAHPAKMQKNKNTGMYDPPTLYDISGSANFNNKADFGITVHRHFEEGFVEVVVQKVRFKHLGKKGAATFKYNLNNGRYVPYVNGIDAEWDNSNHLVKAMLNNEVAAANTATLDFAEEGDDSFQPSQEVPY